MNYLLSISEVAVTQGEGCFDRTISRKHPFVEELILDNEKTNI
jgi:hypothetical protein